MPKNLKNKTTERCQRQKDRDYFGVVLEEIRSEIKLTREGYAALDVKIDKNHRETREFMDITENNFKTVFKFMDATESNFKTIFQCLSNMDDELKEIKAEITEIKETLYKKADIDRLKILETRIMNLENENMELRKIVQNIN